MTDYTLELYHIYSIYSMCHEAKLGSRDKQNETLLSSLQGLDPAVLRSR